MTSRTTPCPGCGEPKQATAAMCADCRTTLRRRLVALSVRGNAARRAERHTAGAIAAAHAGDEAALGLHRRALLYAMARAHGVRVVRGEL